MSDLSTTRDRLIDDLVEDFLQRRQLDESSLISSYEQAHPEHAAEIRAVLEPLQLLDRDRQKGARPALPPGIPAKFQLADYEIHGEIGRGGMGIVYRATQKSLSRPVALKVMPATLNSNPDAIARFQQEARASANLHHSNIVPVFDVGYEDGVYFYSMQLIDGVGLDQVIAGQVQAMEADTGRGHSETEPEAPADSASTFEKDRIPDSASASGSEIKAGFWSAWMAPQGSATSFAQIATIGLQAADALAYAHAAGIVHRDIKPANLLLDRRHNVWITDFGLAKVHENDLTRTGDVVGTLRYIAPERFQGIADHRCDQYALGQTLYELIALRPAHDSADRLQLLDQIRNHTPKRLKALVPEVPVDLETIIARAMAREPAARYPDATGLADDLRRFLEGRPIRARRLGVAEQLGRWARRNPSLAAALSAIFVLLLTGLVATAVAMNVFRNQRDRQRDLTELARQRQYDAEMKLGFEEIHSPTGISQLHEILPAWQPAAGESDLRGWEWHFLRHACNEQAFTVKGDTWWAGASQKPGGAQLAAFGTEVSILDVAGRCEVARLLRGNNQTIVAALWMGTSDFAVVTEAGEVIRFDSGSFAEIERFAVDPGVVSVSVHPGQKTLALTTSEQSLFLLDFEQPSDRRKQVVVPPQAFSHTSPGKQRATEYSPDGAWLASANTDQSVSLHDAATLRELVRFRTEHETAIYDLSWNRQSRRLLAAGWDGRISVIDCSDLESPDVRLVTRIGTTIRATGWLDDGRHIVFGGENRVVAMWDLEQNRLVREFKGHLDTVVAIFAGDDRTLISVSPDQTARSWSLDRPPPFGMVNFAPPQPYSRSATWRPDGRVVTIADDDIHVRDPVHLHSVEKLDHHHVLWSATTGKMIAQQGQTLNWVDPAGTVLETVEVGDRQRLSLVEPVTSGAVAAGAGHPVSAEAAALGVASDRRGSLRGPAFPNPVGGDRSTAAGNSSRAVTIAVTAMNPESKSVEVFLWRPESGQPLRKLDFELPYFHVIALHPAGRWLFADKEGVGQLVDLDETGKDEGLGLEELPATAAAWNHAGTMLAVGIRNGQIRLYEQADNGAWTLTRTLPGNRLAVRDLAFHPADDRLASVGDDECLNLWNVRTGTPVVRQNHDSAVIDVEWSPNGQSLSTVTQWGDLRVWNAGPW